MPTPALRVGLHHQARAVERGRPGAAPQVGQAELLPGVGDGPRGGLRRRSAGVAAPPWPDRTARPTPTASAETASRLSDRDMRRRIR